MAWTLQTLALQNNVPTNGMTVNAYVVTRFALPATDAAVPDGNPADAGPATSAADPVAGAGYFTLVVPDGEPYWLQASGGGDGHTYWYGPIVGVLSSTQQAFPSGALVTSSRASPLPAHITAASYGATLPVATLNVDSTTGFLASGYILTQNAAFVMQLISYTGKTATTFTGCAGGSGVLPGFGNTVYQGFVNGSRRRTVRLCASTDTPLSTSGGYIAGMATVAGVFQTIVQVGNQNPPQTVPDVGSMQFMATSTVPAGWLACDGSAVSRTTYAELFTAIGTTWGAGDGSTTFNLPDFRGRSPLGAGNGTATGHTSHTLGSLVGEETHVLAATELPAHTHNASSGVSSTTGGNVNFGTQTGKINGTKDAPTDNGTGGGGAHNTLGPSAVVNVLIRYTANNASNILTYLEATWTVDPNGWYGAYAVGTSKAFTWWEEDVPA